MNAVFYGTKPEVGTESEASVAGKEVAASSSSGAVSLPTRKHVLQVSTYQVTSHKSSMFSFLHRVLFLDVRLNAFQ